MFKLIPKTILITFFGALLLYGAEKASAQDIIANGSFETGDYTGWVLAKDGASFTDGTWTIVQNGEAVGMEQEVMDFCDNLLVPQYASCLPVTFQATDGNFLAVQLQNYVQTARMSQDLTLPAEATALTWEMAYFNLAPELSSEQYLAVYIRDAASDAILETLFITGPESPLKIPMTTYPADISKFAGQTVRLDVQLNVGVNFFPVSFDNFRIETTEVPTLTPAVLPPGWAMGEKRGWEGPVPPGLEKKGKVPPGFSKGNKKGWDK